MTTSPRSIYSGKGCFISFFLFCMLLYYKVQTLTNVLNVVTAYLKMNSWCHPPRSYAHSPIQAPKLLLKMIFSPKTLSSPCPRLSNLIRYMLISHGYHMGFNYLVFSLTTINTTLVCRLLTVSRLQRFKRLTPTRMGGTILLAISVQKLPKETNLLTHVKMDITLKLRSSGIIV